MSQPDPLDERLRAVERALTDGEDDLTDLRDAARLARELDALGERVDDVEARLDDLDAATQALRGYVGNVRAVNESVERRADAALAKAEAIEADAETGDGVAPETELTDDQLTEADPTVPCNCHPRRSETTPASEQTDTESDGDSGLLARIAEAL